MRPENMRTQQVGHHFVVRLTHWGNVFAMLGMIMSGMGIYNAHPILPFTFPETMTLGGWLGGSTIWHFAVMWFFVGNGLVYLLFGCAKGGLIRRMLSFRPSDLLHDVRLALTFRLTHESGSYNAIQKAMYAGVLVLGVLMVASGLSIWKPVQFSWLTALFGGFDFARVVHFLGMAAILGFIVIHVGMVALVPKTLLSMVFGAARITSDAQRAGLTEKTKEPEHDGKA